MNSPVVLFCYMVFKVKGTLEYPCLTQRDGRNRNDTYSIDFQETLFKIADDISKILLFHYLKKITNSCKKIIRKILIYRIKIKKLKID